MPPRSRCARAPSTSPSRGTASWSTARSIRTTPHRTRPFWHKGWRRTRRTTGVRRRPLTGSQIEQLAQARPAPVQSLQPNSKTAVKTTSVIGLVLLFLMLTQYNTWIMTGVMQEKVSRVVEVLLATVRPLQLLGGKVLGIGLVAMGQAALIVGFALVVAAAVGSDILHGTAPLVLVSELCGWSSAMRSIAGSMPRRAPWPNARTRCRPWRSR